MLNSSPAIWISEVLNHWPQFWDSAALLGEKVCDATFRPSSWQLTTMEYRRSKCEAGCHDTGSGMIQRQTAISLSFGGREITLNRESASD